MYTHEIQILKPWKGPTNGDDTIPDYVLQDSFILVRQVLLDLRSEEIRDIEILITVSTSVTNNDTLFRYILNFLCSKRRSKSHFFGCFEWLIHVYIFYT